MVRKEWKFIRNNKLILISVLAIIFIPFLYSIFFLKSVWDPYGDTKNLPVAVVNLDQPVKYQGQRLAVGDEMVDNLKHNHQLGWHFVSAKKAKEGMKDKKYYTVVTIPKDFSANAATVTDKNPKKMQLKYSTNASLNYIGKVISDVGTEKLNSEVREQVTKSYATAMFDQVKTAGKGFKQASDGAKKLKDGAVQLNDGTKTYTAGVSQLHDDGIATMAVSVKPLQAGVAQLADGSSQLTNGLDQLNGKTGALSSGVSQLANGSGQVTTGAVALSKGLNELQQKSGALVTGVSQLNNGALQLKVKVPQYVNGVYQLNDGVQELNAKTGQLVGGIKQLSSGAGALSAGVKQYTDGVSAGAGQLQGGVAKLANDTKDMPSSINALHNGIADIAKSSKQLADANGKISTGLGQVADQVSANDISKQAAALKQQMASIQTQLVALNKATAGQTNGGNTAQSINNQLSKIKSDVGSLTQVKLRQALAVAFLKQPLILKLTVQD